VLRAQVNRYAPERDTSSDGTIGDEAHQSSDSDHNPWIVDDNGVGVVSAIDFTDSPETGLDCNQLADALLASRDLRIKYFIHDGQICAGNEGPSPWLWRDYTGSNPHESHLHLSVLSEPEYYDDPSPWGRNPIT
jgi:hypothetical protein